MPRSVVVDGSEVSEPGDAGTLTVKRWWAVKGDRLPAARRRLAAMRRSEPEERFTAEVFIRWRTLAQESTDNPLAPIVLRLLRMVVGMAEERLKATPEA